MSEVLLLPSASVKLFTTSLLHFMRKKAAVWIAELATEATARTRPLNHIARVTQEVSSMLYQSKPLEMTPAMRAAWRKH